MTATRGRKKKPPTFYYLPKSRAHRLKKSWVEQHKIRSKWRAQKRREGLANQTSVPAKDTSNPHNRTHADPNADASPTLLDKSPVPTPSHDEQFLRDLRRIAYTSKSLPTQKADLSHPKKVLGLPHKHSGNAAVRRKTGQPNMKLRMNVLLEKIKRDS